MVSELRRMNDEVFENQRDEDNSIRDSEPFKKEYAAVLLQLSQVNDQVSIVPSVASFPFLLSCGILITTMQQSSDSLRVSEREEREGS